MNTVGRQRDAPSEKLIASMSYK